MKDDLQMVIGWKLEEARVWLQAQHGANCELRIVETPPPAKPPRREKPQSKKVQTNAPQAETSKSRERAGDWRVLRCRYLNTANQVGQNDAAVTCRAVTAIEIVTAREILRNE